MTLFFPELILFAVFLAASAFFAFAETALIALTRVDLARLRETAPAAAGRIERLKREPARLLSAALLGQNLANSAASAIATVMAENVLGERAGVAVAVVVATICLFSVGEMMPKSIAAAAPARVAGAISRPFDLFLRVVAPFAAVVNFIVTRTLRLFGLPAAAPSMTEEEMRALIHLGHTAGVIGRRERMLMERVLEFGDRSVSEIMIPRPNVVAIPAGASYEEVRRMISTHKFSRFPVFRGSLDEVTGILRAKDFFELPPAEAARFRLPEHVSPAFLVPETKRVDALFREMRKTRQHMAVVLDEYGGTAGLVTIEDVIESILGSIQDEYDEETPGYVRVAPGTYLLDGTFRLEQLERRFGLSYPDADAETVAGLLLCRFGRIPRPGERLRGRQAEFVVADATPMAIRRVKLILPAAGRRRGA